MQCRSTCTEKACIGCRIALSFMKMQSSDHKNQNSSKNHALMVASGILLSRISGLIRVRVFAHYFGNSDAGDAFNAALKIPNFLQNLFGEGVLSASFIPVYASLLSEHKKEDANKVAGAIGSLLAFFISLLVLIGTLITPMLIDLVAPGFTGDKKTLTIQLVQIFFPGTGLLVMSAWCLGILNSHRKFFLSYAAPVIWNFTIIATLVIFGSHSSQESLAVKAAWGLVLGSALQLLVQIPTTLQLARGLKLGFHLNFQPVKSVIKNFFPVLISRGVVQISAYIDNIIASFLPTGAVSALAYSQTIYLLPISLFGMSVSAAELPMMSSTGGKSHEERCQLLQNRLNAGISQIAFFIIPTIVAFLALGNIIVAAIFQTGAFNHDDTYFVWGILAGSTVGLMASTIGRLYSSAFYALQDTRTPLKMALIRVFLTTLLGYLFALKAPDILGFNSLWGTAGLTSSAGLAGWIEFLLLRSKMNKKIGHTGFSHKKIFQIWCCAIFSASISFSISYFLPPIHHVIIAALTLAPFGLIYFILTTWLNIPEAALIAKKLRLKR